MALTLKTPGVYIQELDAFPSSVVQVATAVPAFVGLTQKAERGGKSLVGKPTRVTSLAEFHALFGKEFETRFDVIKQDSQTEHSFMLNGEPYEIKRVDGTRSYFYDSIRMFYSNGGGPCYIVSCGVYDGQESLQIQKQDFTTGINSLVKEDEPTMIVLPDATLLEDHNECYDLYKDILMQCGKLQSRFGIFDVYNGDQEWMSVEGEDKRVEAVFRDGMGNQNLKYGAAYYPWLRTSIIAANELDFRNFNSMDDLKNALVEKDAKGLVDQLNTWKSEDKMKEEVDRFKAKIAAEQSGLSEEEVEAQAVEKAKDEIKVKLLMIDNALLASSPTYKNLINEVKRQINVLPPSAVMAGVYSMVDFTRGVWKAPANHSLNAVIAPTVTIDDDEQALLNVDANSGKSINVIRTFPGAGVLVWGARTLDGNSQDWRYINVRRTMIMIEQSIKKASQRYVFEPNVQSTWSDMRIMIESFLNGLWKQGALAGPSPDSAYLVQVGLGSTMTPNDILEGIMRITVKVAISRPAEFIVLTFQQKMQEGGGGE